MVTGRAILLSKTDTGRKMDALLFGRPTLRLLRLPLYVDKESPSDTTAGTSFSRITLFSLEFDFLVF